MDLTGRMQDQARNSCSTGQGICQITKSSKNVLLHNCTHTVYIWIHKVRSGPVTDRHNVEVCIPVLLHLKLEHFPPGNKQTKNIMPNHHCLELTVQDVQSRLKQFSHFILQSDTRHD